MSHLQGTDYVGSMVVMEDGLPKRSDYRRFKVTAVQGNDDYGAMHEVLTRRLRRLRDAGRGRRGCAEVAEAAARDRVVEGRRETPPFRLSATAAAARRREGAARGRRRVVAELGLSGRSQLPPSPSSSRRSSSPAGPSRSGSPVTPRRSTCCSRFATRRTDSRSASTASAAASGCRGALDGVAGLGPSRRRRLVSELGGVRQVQAATLDELPRLAWLPDTVARAVYAHLHGRRPSKAG